MVDCFNFAALSPAHALVVNQELVESSFMRVAHFLHLRGNARNARNVVLWDPKVIGAGAATEDISSCACFGPSWDMTSGNLREQWSRHHRHPGFVKFPQ